MDQLPQPNFQQLSQHLTSACHEISLIPNIPAVIDGQTITNQLQQITQQLARQAEQMTIIVNGLATLNAEVATIKTEVAKIKTEVATIGTRMDASETNTIARLYNANITHSETPLYPLKNHQNRPVDGFPDNARALTNLTGPDLSNLLRAYDQAVDGTVSAKRKRFRQFVGIMTDV